MIRTAPFLVLALALAAPASAGSRAVYSDGTEGKPLVIEVADNGDARVSGGEEGEYGLLIGGRFYVVGRDAAGKPRVAAIEDVATALDRVIPPVFKGLLAGAPRAPTKGFRAVKTGARTVAGHAGVVYAVYGLDESKPEAPTEYVLSTDPALRPLGTAMAKFMDAAIVPAAPLIGAGAADIIADTHAIFALGTPLDAGRFRLTALDPMQVPPEALALPAKPATVDELVAEMKRAQAAREPAPPAVRPQ